MGVFLRNSGRFITGIILGSAIHFSLPNYLIDGMHKLNQELYNLSKMYDQIETVEKGAVTLFQGNEKLLKNVYSSMKFIFPLRDVNEEIQEISERIGEEGEINEADSKKLRELLFNSDGKLKLELFVGNGEVNLTSTMLTSVISANEMLSPLTQVVENNLDNPVVGGAHGIAKGITEAFGGLFSRGQAALEEAQKAEEAARIAQEDAKKARDQALKTYEAALVSHITILRRLELLETEVSGLFQKYLDEFSKSIQQANTEDTEILYGKLVEYIVKSNPSINFPTFQETQEMANLDYDQYVSLFTQLQQQMNKLRTLILVRTQNLNQNEEFDEKIKILVDDIEANVKEIEELLGETMNSSLLEDASYNTLVGVLKRIETLPISLIGGWILTFGLFPGIYHGVSAAIRRRKERLENKKNN